MASLNSNFSVYVSRRKDLWATVKDEFVDNMGTIILFSNFENDRIRFRQDSSFYYYTGITEPGSVLVIDSEGKTTLWVPHSMIKRAQWVESDISLTQQNAARLGINEIRFLGSQSSGYQFHPFFNKDEYDHFTTFLKTIIENNIPIFTLIPDDASSYVEQRLILERLHKFVPNLAKAIKDISFIVHEMRRNKDIHEIELLYKAVDITNLAQEAAARTIQEAANEAEVQASLEYIITGSQARIAFPSIVAGGKNGTVLHYMNNNSILQKGDLVVVDIGAEYGYYCADITRTYPVSGIFSDRQRELYTVVLNAQQYIADLARPGYWLSNSKYPEKSLHHLAQKFIDNSGYGRYFIHGIGHFLGMDVHDVGNYQEPLKNGDVFTIEPGIYLPQENIGIRIEDDYWMTKDNTICLSENLPKTIEEIEQMMKKSNDEFNQIDDDFAQG